MRHEASMQFENNFLRRKGALDRVAAACLLLPALPVIGLLVLLVRLTSPGPGIFSQVRVGKSGRNYTMFKLRSMRCDAEAKTGPAWTKGCGDPRITPLGRWLRKLHLDELPQLWNVLRGDMSLVGPRPERPEFVSVLKDAIPGYENRLVVRPGITGLAQINLPPDEGLDSVRRKQILDLQYTREATLWLDLKILVSTAMRIVGIPGALAARAAGVERSVELPNLQDTVSDKEAAALSDTTTLKALVAQTEDEVGNRNGSANHSNGHMPVGNDDTNKPLTSERSATTALVQQHPK